MKSEKKRANLENAQPLRYYATTLRAFYGRRLRPAYSEVVPTCQKPARNERPSPGHCITAQNPRVSTLYAARQHSVPPPNLLGRFKFEKLRFLSRKCLKEAVVDIYPQSRKHKAKTAALRLAVPCGGPRVFPLLVSIYWEKKRKRKMRKENKENQRKRDDATPRRFTTKRDATPQPAGKHPGHR